MMNNYFLTSCRTLIKAEVKEPRVGFRTINEDYESAVKKYGKCGVYAMWDKKRAVLRDNEKSWIYKCKDGYFDGLAIGKIDGKLTDVAYYRLGFPLMRVDLVNRRMFFKNGGAVADVEYKKDVAKTILKKIVNDCRSFCESIL